MVKNADNDRSPKARRNYALTAKGTRFLAALRRQVDELHREVVREARRKGR
jgi:DNA-binding PadR family transcriptional regulator